MKNFFKQRWHLHILAGALIVTPLIWLLIKYDSSFDIGKLGQIFIAGFAGFLIGLIWEAYNEKYHESPFDKYDAIFTAIGAMVGTLILIL